jgi:hypothetical protein
MLFEIAASHTNNNASTIRLYHRRKSHCQSSEFAHPVKGSNHLHNFRLRGGSGNLSTNSQESEDTNISPNSQEDKNYNQIIICTIAQMKSRLTQIESRATQLESNQQSTNAQLVAQLESMIAQLGRLQVSYPDHGHRNECCKLFLSCLNTKGEIG